MGFDIIRLLGWCFFLFLLLLFHSCSRLTLKLLLLVLCCWLFTDHLSHKKLFLERIIFLKHELVKSKQILIRIFMWAQALFWILHILAQIVEHLRVVLDNLMFFGLMFHYPSLQLLNKPVFVLYYGTHFFFFLLPYCFCLSQPLLDGSPLLM